MSPFLLEILDIPFSCATAQVSQSPEPDSNKVQKVDKISKPANKQAGSDADGHSLLASTELSQLPDSKMEHADEHCNPSTQGGSDTADDDNLAETATMLSSQVFEEVVG
jgi:hypothetical protein